MAQYSEYSINGGGRGPWQTHMAACGGWWTLEGERILQILQLYLCTVTKAGLSIDAAHFGAGVFSFYRWQTGCLCTEVLLSLQVLHINRPQTGTQRRNPEMSYDVRAALLSAGGLTGDCLVFTLWSWSWFFIFFLNPASDCSSNLIQGHPWKWSLRKGCFLQAWPVYSLLTIYSLSTIV